MAARVPGRYDRKRSRVSDEKRAKEDNEQIDRSMQTERTFAMLSSTFGILALVLSAVGLYGAIANAVSRRRKELSIRLALGAEPRRILRLVLGEAGLLVALGAAAGLPCALLTGRAIRSLLFGIQSGDRTRVAAALGVLVTVAGFAAWIPARRASRVDPMVALRSEWDQRCLDVRSSKATQEVS